MIDFYVILKKVWNSTNNNEFRSDRSRIEVDSRARATFCASRDTSSFIELKCRLDSLAVQVAV